MNEKRIHIFIEIVIVLVLSLAMVSSISIKTVHAQAGQVGLLPTDDTTVYSGDPNLTFGQLSYLEIENYQSFTQTFKSIAWLKFNLSSVPDGAVIDNATLHLYGSTLEPYDVHTYSCSNDSWTESSLTYSNMPSYNTTSMDSILVSGFSQWFNWSVVDAVRDALNSNAKAVTIVLFDPSTHSNSSTVTFDSKEATIGLHDTRPALTIHWSSSVPEFPTFLILPSFMITTLLAVIIYKRRHAKISESPKKFFIKVLLL